MKLYKQPFTGLLQNGALAIVQYPTEEILWIAKKKKKLKKELGTIFLLKRYFLYIYDYIIILHFT